VLRKSALACAGTAAAMLIAVGAADAHTGARAASPQVSPASRAAAARATSKPTFNVYKNGVAADSTCGGFENHQTTKDWAAYSERYAADGGTLTNWEIGCAFQGSTAPASVTTLAGCGDGAAPLPAKGVQAMFADGEGVVVCGDPDVKGSKHSNANSVPVNVLSSATACAATVLSGAKGTTAITVNTDDSVQIDQNYTDYDGDPVSAVTTACVGVVPAGKSVSSSVAVRAIKCSEANPFGSASLAGNGVTVTYPDREFEEICEVPNAPARSS
jgi:hypothetical protein